MARLLSSLRRSCYGGGGPCEAWWRGRPHAQSLWPPPPPPTGGPPPPLRFASRREEPDRSSPKACIVFFERVNVDRGVAGPAEFFVVLAARLHVGGEDRLGVERD